MNYVEVIGFAAGIGTTIAFLPQVIKIWKTKSTKDISLIMFVVFSIGVFLWLVYGILIDSIPVIIANFITFILTFIILIFKVRYH